MSSELIERDIVAYLDAHEHKSLLRFITCGSVDDGASRSMTRPSRSDVRAVIISAMISASVSAGDSMAPVSG